MWSIIFPMLFNIYMRPLGEVIRGFGVSGHQCADVTQHCLSFRSPVADAALSLECILATVLGWMRDKILRMNPDNMYSGASLNKRTV